MAVFLCSSEGSALSWDLITYLLPVPNGRLGGIVQNRITLSWEKSFFQR